MEWHQFLEAYNWCLMYIHGHDREWIKNGANETGMLYRRVYDEEHENWIDYMKTDREAGKYVFSKKRNCFVLPKGK